ncbi:hypothetical protein E5D57_008453 [Metarhizium anisopliae]|nr:hypothetical protein E5D57_008453 [Metarhizium anisopliae]
MAGTQSPYYYFTLLNLNIGTSWGSLSKSLDATKANLLNQVPWNASRRGSYAQMPFGKLQKESQGRTASLLWILTASGGKFTGATAAIEANHGSGGSAFWVIGIDPVGHSTIRLSHPRWIFANRAEERSRIVQASLASNHQKSIGTSCLGA